MSQGLQVRGGRQLRASLKAAGLSVQDLKDAHKAVAELVLRQAEPHTPMGETGKLKRSQRAAGTQTAAIVRAGTAAVPYAGPIHWGWAARHITAQPWIAEAAQSTEAAWLGQYMHALETIVHTIEGVPYP